MLGKNLTKANYHAYDLMFAALLDTVCYRKLQPTVNCCE